MTATNSKTAFRLVRMPRVLALAAGFAIGCAADQPGATPAVDDETAPVAAAGRRPDEPIHGTDFNRFRFPDGRVELSPIDLSTTPIEAQLEHDGGFDVHPGVGKADGTFTVDGVARGRSYWLRVGTNWYLTDERSVDVGVDKLGRPDATGAAAGTSLVFDVDGLLPVTSGDDFQIEAPNAQIGFYSVASALNPITANAPNVGDTALAGAVFPFDAVAAAGTSQFPLIQASRGDTLTLAQLTTLPLGSLTYQSLSRALTTSVEMTQGAATTVSGTMTAPPLSTTRVDFRQGDFEALADGVRSGAVVIGADVLIDVSVGRQRVNLGTPDLAVVFPPPGNGNQVLPLQYRNPYPSSWPLFAVGGATYQVPFTGIADDGSPTPRQTSSSTASWEFVERGAATVFPVISPVRDVTIDGEPVDDEIRDVTATPLLSWKRPRHGSPAAYIVRIAQVNAQAPFASTAATRLVVAPDVHRVRIPAGLLQSGGHYFFRVVAVASSEPRQRGQLDIMFVPPRAQIVDAFSGTIRVE